jgi:hypothetical protein
MRQYIDTQYQKKSSHVFIGAFSQHEGLELWYVFEDGLSSQGFLLSPGGETTHTALALKGGGTSLLRWQAVFLSPADT